VTSERLRLELFTAAQNLRGEDLADFWKLIDELCSLTRTVRVSVDEAVQATAEFHLRAMLDILTREGGALPWQDQLALREARTWLRIRR
jgi:hypothetical protein